MTYLKQKALENLEEKKSKLGKDNLISDFDELSEENVIKLNSQNINSKDDLADLSVDELLDMIELSHDVAGKIIMKARERWNKED